jgi:hypothetical protein
LIFKKVIPMKNCVALLFFLAAFCTASAQTPYTPRENGAITAIKNRAASDGYTNPQLTGVATVKGNYPVGIFTLNNKFDVGSETVPANDQNKGKAGFWGYLVRSEAKPDSARAYIAVDGGTIFGYIVFDAPAGIDLAALPGNFSMNLPTNGDGSPAWMNTPEFVDRLRTNSTYMSYRQSHQDSTPDYVALGMSKLATPTFPAGTPLWTVTFTGDTPSDFMSCSVHALTGEVECVMAPTSVAESAFKNSFAVSPNPARTSVSVSIPAELYSLSGKIEIFNVLGEKIYSFKMSGIGEDHSVIIPVENYPAGMYFVHYTNGNRSQTQALTIE